jgi:crotonobetainyl-CoA:carnitine CoA-transferase CaiB-like acyl-CoA transferase
MLNSGSPTPLSGTTVVDLTRYLAGPTATMLLADLGADVIKVETLPGGDPARQPGPFAGDQGVYFIASNRNKRSLAVDLRDQRGVELVQKLAARADVVVENFRPGVVSEIGIGPSDLWVDNPRLVYCSLSGFGSKGPGRSLPGFDQSAQAMSGLMSVTGTEETGPLRVGIAIGDSITGVTGGVAILAGLLEARATGVGVHVESSLIESLTSLMSYQAQRYLSLAEVPGQDGNDHPLMFPQGTFKTKGQPITIASGNEAMWAQLCEILGEPDLATDTRFDTNERRMENRRELRAIIESLLASNEADFWLQRLNEAGIPCSPIWSLEQTLESDIVQGLGMVTTKSFPDRGTMQMLSRPFTLNGDRGEISLPPPRLGEHTREICLSIGLSPEEIDTLITEGVVAG